MINYMSGERRPWSMGQYQRFVPRDTDFFYGSNSRNSIAFKPLTNCQVPKIEQGHTWWIPIQNNFVQGCS